MSAAESEFVFLTEEDLKAAPAPRADRRVEPDKRVQSFGYKSGHLEFRTALPGQYLNTDEPADLEEWR